MRHFVYILSILFFLPSCQKEDFVSSSQGKGTLILEDLSVQVGNINTVLPGPWRMIYMWRFGKTVN